MPDIQWPDDLAPFQCEFYLQAHSGGSESPFSRQSKIYGLSAPRWVCRLSFRGGDSADRWGSSEYATWGPRIEALLASVGGRQGRIALWDFRRPEPTGGWADGVSNEAAVRGASVITLTGLDDGAVIPVGDYFGGDGRTHIITHEAVANADGEAVVAFKPPLAASISAGEAVFERSTSLFRPLSDDIGANASTVGELTVYTVELVEDLGGEAASIFVSDEGVSRSAFYFGGSMPGGSAYVVDHGTSANNFDGRFDTFTADRLNPVLSPDQVWLAKSVVLEDGSTITTTEGDLPFDWSQGRRLLKINYADNFKIPRDVLPDDTRAVFVRLKYVPGPMVGTYDHLFGVGASTEWPADIGIVYANLPEMCVTASMSSGGTNSADMGEIRDLCRHHGEMLFVISWNELGTAISINGEPAAFFPTGDEVIDDMPDWDAISIRPDSASGTALYIEAFGTISRELSSTEVANKLNGAALHPYMVSALTMGDSHTTPTTGTERMPSAHLLGRTSGGGAVIRGFHHQRDLSGSHIEGPRRIMGQTVRFDGRRLTSPTRRSEVEWQDPDNNFAAGYGWVAAEQAVQRTYGPNRGRWIQVFEEIPGTTAIPSGAYESDIKWRYSDDGMATWTAPAMVLDASALYGANATLLTGVGAGVEFSANGAYPNRVMFPIYRWTPTAQVGVLWTDDDGATWDHSLYLSGFGGEAPNETTIALLPDETIVLTHRIETDDVRFWSTSTDGGATFTNEGQMPDYLGAYTNAEMIQLDPAGLEGPRGLLAMLRATRSPDNPWARDGLLVSFYRDSDMNPEDEAYVLSRLRNWGYVNGIIPLTIRGKRYWIFAVESSIREYNRMSSSHIVAIRDPRDVS